MTEEEKEGSVSKIQETGFFSSVGNIASDVFTFAKEDLFGIESKINDPLKTADINKSANIGTSIYDFFYDGGVELHKKQDKYSTGLQNANNEIEERAKSGEMTSEEVSSIVNSNMKGTTYFGDTFVNWMATDGSEHVEELSTAVEPSLVEQRMLIDHPDFDAGQFTNFSQEVIYTDTHKNKRIIDSMQKSNDTLQSLFYDKMNEEDRMNYYEGLEAKSKLDYYNKYLEEEGITYDQLTNEGKVLFEQLNTSINKMDAIDMNKIVDVEGVDGIGGGTFADNGNVSYTLSSLIKKIEDQTKQREDYIEISTGLTIDRYNEKYGIASKKDTADKDSVISLGISQTKSYTLKNAELKASGLGDAEINAELSNYTQDELKNIKYLDIINSEEDKESKINMQYIYDDRKKAVTIMDNHADLINQNWLKLNNDPSYSELSNYELKQKNIELYVQGLSQDKLKEIYDAESKIDTSGFLIDVHSDSTYRKITGFAHGVPRVLGESIHLGASGMEGVVQNALESRMSGMVHTTSGLFTTLKDGVLSNPDDLATATHGIFVSFIGPKGTGLKSIGTGIDKIVRTTKTGRNISNKVKGVTTALTTTKVNQQLVAIKESIAAGKLTKEAKAIKDFSLLIDKYPSIGKMVNTGKFLGASFVQGTIIDSSLDEAMGTVTTDELLKENFAFNIIGDTLIGAPIGYAISRYYKPGITTSHLIKQLDKGDKGLELTLDTVRYNVYKSNGGTLLTRKGTLDLIADTTDVLKINRVAEGTYDPIDNILKVVGDFVSSTSGVNKTFVDSVGNIVSYKTLIGDLYNQETRAARLETLYNKAIDNGDTLLAETYKRNLIEETNLIKALLVKEGSDAAKKLPKIEQTSYLENLKQELGSYLGSTLKISDEAIDKGVRAELDIQLKKLIESINSGKKISTGDTTSLIQDIKNAISEYGEGATAGGKIEMYDLVDGSIKEVDMKSFIVNAKALGYEKGITNSDGTLNIEAAKKALYKEGSMDLERKVYYSDYNNERFYGFSKESVTDIIKEKHGITIPEKDIHDVKDIKLGEKHSNIIKDAATGKDTNLLSFEKIIVDDETLKATHKGLLNPDSDISYSKIVDNINIESKKIFKEYGIDITDDMIFSIEGISKYSLKNITKAVINNGFFGTTRVNHLFKNVRISAMDKDKAKEMVTKINDIVSAEEVKIYSKYMNDYYGNDIIAEKIYNIGNDYVGNKLILDKSLKEDGLITIAYGKVQDIEKGGNSIIYMLPGKGLEGKKDISDLYKGIIENEKLNKKGDIPKMNVLAPSREYVRDILNIVKKQGISGENASKYINVILEEEAFDIRKFVDGLDMDKTTRINLNSSVVYLTKKIINNLDTGLQESIQKNFIYNYLLDEDYLNMLFNSNLHNDAAHDAVTKVLLSDTSRNGIIDMQVTKGLKDSKNGEKSTSDNKVLNLINKEYNKLETNFNANNQVLEGELARMKKELSVVSKEKPINNFKIVGLNNSIDKYKKLLKNKGLISREEFIENNLGIMMYKDVSGEISKQLRETTSKLIDKELHIKIGLLEREIKDYSIIELSGGKKGDEISELANLKNERNTIVQELNKLKKIVSDKKLDSEAKISKYYDLINKKNTTVDYYQTQMNKMLKYEANPNNILSEVNINKSNEHGIKIKTKEEFLNEKNILEDLFIDEINKLKTLRNKLNKNKKVDDPGEIDINYTKNQEENSLNKLIREIESKEIKLQKALDEARLLKNNKIETVDNLTKAVNNIKDTIDSQDFIVLQKHLNEGTEIKVIESENYIQGDVLYKVGDEEVKIGTDLTDTQLEFLIKTVDDIQKAQSPKLEEIKYVADTDTNIYHIDDIEDIIYQKLAGAIFYGDTDGKVNKLLFKNFRKEFGFDKIEGLKNVGDKELLYRAYHHTENGKPTKFREYLDSFTFGKQVDDKDLKSFNDIEMGDDRLVKANGLVAKLFKYKNGKVIKFKSKASNGDISDFNLDNIDSMRFMNRLLSLSTLGKEKNHILNIVQENGFNKTELIYGRTDLPITYKEVKIGIKDLDGGDLSFIGGVTKHSINANLAGTVLEYESKNDPAYMGKVIGLINSYKKGNISTKQMRDNFGLKEGEIITGGFGDKDGFFMKYSNPELFQYLKEGQEYQILDFIHSLSYGYADGITVGHKEAAKRYKKFMADLLSKLKKNNADYEKRIKQGGIGESDYDNRIDQITKNNKGIRQEKDYYIDNEGNKLERLSNVLSQEKNQSRIDAMNQRDGTNLTIADLPVTEKNERAIGFGIVTHSYITDILHGKAISIDTHKYGGYPIYKKDELYKLRDGIKAFKKTLQDNGETLHINKIFSGNGIATEINLFTVDKKGKVRLYDFTTTKQSGNTFINQQERIEIQSDMFESTTLIKPSELKIVPILLDYDDEFIKSIEFMPNRSSNKIIDGDRNTVFIDKPKNTISEEEIRKKVFNDNPELITSLQKGKAGGEEGFASYIKNTKKRDSMSASTKRIFEGLDSKVDTIIVEVVLDEGLLKSYKDGVSIDNLRIQAKDLGYKGVDGTSDEGFLKMFLDDFEDGTLHGSKDILNLYNRTYGLKGDILKTHIIGHIPTGEKFAYKGLISAEHDLINEAGDILNKTVLIGENSHKLDGGFIPVDPNLPVEYIYKNGIKYKVLGRNEGVNLSHFKEAESTVEVKKKEEISLSSIIGGFDRKYMLAFEELQIEEINKAIEGFFKTYGDTGTQGDVFGNLNKIVQDLSRSTDQKKILLTQEYYGTKYEGFLDNIVQIIDKPKANGGQFKSYKVDPSLNPDEIKIHPDSKLGKKLKEQFGEDDPFVVTARYPVSDKYVSGIYKVTFDDTISNKHIVTSPENAYMKLRSDHDGDTIMTYSIKDKKIDIIAKAILNETDSSEDLLKLSNDDFITKISDKYTNGERLNKYIEATEVDKTNIEVSGMTLTESRMSGLEGKGMINIIPATIRTYDTLNYYASGLKKDFRKEFETMSPSFKKFTVRLLSDTYQAEEFSDVNILLYNLNKLDSANKANTDPNHISVKYERDIYLELGMKLRIDKLGISVEDHINYKLNVSTGELTPRTLTQRTSEIKKINKFLKNYGVDLNDIDYDYVKTHLLKDNNNVETKLTNLLKNYDNTYSTITGDKINLAVDYSNSGLIEFPKGWHEDIFNHLLDSKKGVSKADFEIIESDITNISSGYGRSINLSGYDVEEKLIGTSGLRRNLFLYTQDKMKDFNLIKAESSSLPFILNSLNIEGISNAKVGNTIRLALTKGRPIPGKELYTSSTIRTKDIEGKFGATDLLAVTYKFNYEQSKAIQDMLLDGVYLEAKKGKIVSTKVVGPLKEIADDIRYLDEQAEFLYKGEYINREEVEKSILKINNYIETGLGSDDKIIELALLTKTFNKKFHKLYKTYNQGTVLSVQDLFSDKLMNLYLNDSSEFIQGALKKTEGKVFSEYHSSILRNLSPDELSKVEIDLKELIENNKYYDEATQYYDETITYINSKRINELEIEAKDLIIRIENDETLLYSMNKKKAGYKKKLKEIKDNRLKKEYIDEEIQLLKDHDAKILEYGNSKLTYNKLIDSISKEIGLDIIGASDKEALELIEIKIKELNKTSNDTRYKNYVDKRLTKIQNIKDYNDGLLKDIKKSKEIEVKNLESERRKIFNDFFRKYEIAGKKEISDINEIKELIKKEKGLVVSNKDLDMLKSHLNDIDDSIADIELTKQMDSDIPPELSNEEYLKAMMEEIKTLKDRKLTTLEKALELKSSKELELSNFKTVTDGNKFEIESFWSKDMEEAVYNDMKGITDSQKNYIYLRDIEEIRQKNPEFLDTLNGLSSSLGTNNKYILNHRILFNKINEDIRFSLNESTMWENLTTYRKKAYRSRTIGFSDTQKDIEHVLRKTFANSFKAHGGTYTYDIDTFNTLFKKNIEYKFKDKDINLDKLSEEEIALIEKYNPNVSKNDFNKGHLVYSILANDGSLSKSVKKYTDEILHPMSDIMNKLDIDMGYDLNLLQKYKGSESNLVQDIVEAMKGDSNLTAHLLGLSDKENFINDFIKKGFSLDRANAIYAHLIRAEIKTPILDFFNYLSYQIKYGAGNIFHGAGSMAGLQQMIGQGSEIRTRRAAFGIDDQEAYKIMHRYKTLSDEDTHVYASGVGLQNQDNIIGQKVSGFIDGAYYTLGEKTGETLKGIHDFATSPLGKHDAAFDNERRLAGIVYAMDKLGHRTYEDLVLSIDRFGQKELLRLQTEARMYYNELGGGVSSKDTMYKMNKLFNHNAYNEVDNGVRNNLIRVWDKMGGYLNAWGFNKVFKNIELLSKTFHIVGNGTKAQKIKAVHEIYYAAEGRVRNALYLSVMGLKYDKYQTTSDDDSTNAMNFTKMLHNDVVSLQSAFGFMDKIKQQQQDLNTGVVGTTGLIAYNIGDRFFNQPGGIAKFLNTAMNNISYTNWNDQTSLQKASAIWTAFNDTMNTSGGTGLRFTKMYSTEGIEEINKGISLSSVLGYGYMSENSEEVGEIWKWYGNDRLISVGKKWDSGEPVNAVLDALDILFIGGSQKFQKHGVILKDLEGYIRTNPILKEMRDGDTNLENILNYEAGLDVSDKKHKENKEAILDTLYTHLKYSGEDMELNKDGTDKKKFLIEEKRDRILANEFQNIDIDYYKYAEAGGIDTFEEYVYNKQIRLKEDYTVPEVTAAVFKSRTDELVKAYKAENNIKYSEYSYKSDIHESLKLEALLSMDGLLANDMELKEKLYGVTAWIDPEIQSKYKEITGSDLALTYQESQKHNAVLGRVEEGFGDIKYNKATGKLENSSIYTVAGLIQNPETAIGMMTEYEQTHTREETEDAYLDIMVNVSKDLNNELSTNPVYQKKMDEYNIHEKWANYMYTQIAMTEDYDPDSTKNTIATGGYSSSYYPDSYSGSSRGSSFGSRTEPIKEYLNNAKEYLSANPYQYIKDNFTKPDFLQLNYGPKAKDMVYYQMQALRSIQLDKQGNIIKETGTGQINQPKEDITYKSIKNVKKIRVSQPKVTSSIKKTRTTANLLRNKPFNYE